MQQVRKVLCVIGVGIICVFLAVSTAYACCGVNPTITDDPIDPVCPGENVTISGTITGTATYGPSYYSTGPVTLTIEVTDPSANKTTITATLFNLQEYPSATPYAYATWDFSEEYTTNETGVYTYVKTTGWYNPIGGTMYNSASGTFVVEECEGLALDIKPGSCPNPFNAKSKGNVPVAIIGTDSFDVTTINPASITLEGVPALKWSIEDVTQPNVSDPEAEECKDCFEEPAPIYDPEGNLIWEYAGDGFDDLVVQFDTQALAAVIAAMGAARDDCVVLTLSGLAGDPAEPFECSDSVIIRTK